MSSSAQFGCDSQLVVLRIVAVHRQQRQRGRPSVASSNRGGRRQEQQQSVGASRTSLGTKAGSSTSRLLSRPMSAPSLHALVVPPTEDELGVPGSVSRPMMSSPRADAGHGVLLGRCMRTASKARAAVRLFNLRRAESQSIIQKTMGRRPPREPEPWRIERTRI